MRETIAAIASGMTASGIGIIRISGPDAFRVLGKVFRFANKNKTVENVKPNTIHYGHIIDYEVGSRSDGQAVNKQSHNVLSDIKKDDGSRSDGQVVNKQSKNVLSNIEKDDGSQSDGNHVNTRNQDVLSDIETDDVCRSEEQPVDTLNRYVRNETVIDEVLVMIMKGPHTYTAEDTVEIDCHGGPFVMQKILSSVLKAGARAAEPGEFTKRAFLNGRIDLTEAEAVMDVISSGSEDALKSSLMQLDGSVRREIESLRERILTELAYIEAALDDPEHYDLEGYPEELDEKLVNLLTELERLMASFDEGKLIREGIFTVILGKPNAGKSSLLNYLTGEERAIVTEIAGTTRDSLEETVRLGGLILRIADTAGIRSTGDIIEKMGVDRAMSLAEKADLLLAVFDSSRPLDGDDTEILSFISGRKALILLNKSDLETVVDEEEIRKYSDAPIVVISAKMNEGRELIEAQIREMFFSGKLHVNEEIMLTNVRHKEACEEASASLRLVRESIESGMPEDFYAVDLMDAYAALGRIIGEQVGEDLVDMIFAKFCMGK